MNPKQAPPPPPGLALADIYYVIFRHKWLIGGALITGLVAAGIVYAVWPKTFQSEAKLYVQYVVDKKSPNILSHDATIKDPDASGADVIYNELGILTSYDLALDVASNVGPKEILAKLGGGNDLDVAAAVIQRNLKAVTERYSDIITITFESRDPAILQPVLAKAIQSYFKRHADIHHPVGEYEDFLTQETDKLRTSLNTLDDQLKEQKNQAKIISLEGTKTDVDNQIAKIHEQMNEAIENLAGHQAAAEALDKLLKTSSASVAPSSNSLSTNAASIAAVPVSTKPATADQLAEYHRLRDLLTFQRKQEADLKLQFNSQNLRVQAIESRIADTQTNLAKLELEAPDLLSIRSADAKSFGVPTAAMDPVAALKAQLDSEMLNVTSIQARIKSLNTLLEQAQKDATNLNALEAPISDLLRKKAAAETNYQYYSTILEQSGVELMLDSGKIPNIRTIESPTPPAVHVSKVLTATGGVFFGFLGLGLGLAFVIEMYVKRSLKNPKDIQGKLGLPCLLSIPWMNGNGHGHILIGAKISGLLANGAAAATDSQIPATNQLPDDAAEGDSRLQPFYESLRDRLISNLDALNLTHKPKLVAVTACHAGAGTTRIATGIAAALSETGEGNVLLVDMNGQDSPSHHFYKGQRTCGIQEALQKEKRGDALVQDNLYVARDFPTSGKLSRGLPKRFSHLLPVMKASDYDYIIFDMPPVTQISVTPRLAGFMDTVLLVVESEKTDREVASHALRWLAEAKANVCVVLNKKRTYVPSRLLPEM